MFPTPSDLQQFTSITPPVSAQFAWWFYGFCCMWILCCAGAAVRTLRMTAGTSTEL